MKGEPSVASWIREANFLSPSSCQVKRFIQSILLLHPPPKIYFVLPVILFQLPSPPFSSHLIPSPRFGSLLKPNNSIFLLCFFVSTSIACRMDAFFFSYLFPVPPKASLSRACRKKTRESHLSLDLCLFEKHICRPTTHHFAMLVKESLPETTVRNVSGSETKNRKREKIPKRKRRRMKTARNNRSRVVKNSDADTIL